MNGVTIEQRVAEFLRTLPAGITLVAAAKTRTQGEVQAAIRGGIKILGYNYIQEAEQMVAIIGHNVRWHMIGHLQRNKAKKAVQLFDMIETVDSLKLAQIIDRHCAEIGKEMPILIEINSGKEASKTGVLPGEVDNLVEQLSQLSHVKVQGLMTMGPITDDPELVRPYFKTTRLAYDRLARAKIPNVAMRYLSMGMSDSYQVAIEEGANVIRIGTRLFGPRMMDTTS